MLLKCISTSQSNASPDRVYLIPLAPAANASIFTGPLQEQAHHRPAAHTSNGTGIPAAIMPTTPMPALPAPTTTMRWSLMACTGLPCTASAPYRPASAVAAVPYIKQLGWCFGNPGRPQGLKLMEQGLWHAWMSSLNTRWWNL